MRIVFLISSIVLIAPGLAQPVPLAELGREGRAETTLGVFTLESWADRHKFPDLSERKVLVRGEPKEDGEAFELEGIPGNITVKEKALNFHTGGRADFGGRWNWTPSLVFTPAEPGVYAISGDADLWTSGQSKAGKEDAISFAVFRVFESDSGERDVTPVVYQRFGKAAKFSLEELKGPEGQPLLGAISVPQGESLAISIWRPSFHHGAGGELGGLTFAKVGDLPPTAGGKASEIPAGTRFVMPLESATATEAGEGPGLTLKPGGFLRLQPDMPYLDRVVIDAKEILDARLNLKVLRHTGSLRGARLEFFRPLDGANVEEKPFLSVPMPDPMPGNRLKIEGLEKVLQSLLEGGAPTEGLLVTLNAEAGTSLVIAGTDSASGQQPKLEIVVKERVKTTLFDPPVKPQAGVYCVREGGRLSYGGKRLRLWGVVGNAKGERLKRMGFNALRLWEVPDVYGSQGGEDPIDAILADLKNEGLFVMYAGLSRAMPVTEMVRDDSPLAGGAGWAGWKDAVTKEKSPERLKLFEFFDERLQTFRKEHVKRVLGHRNRLTGKRLAEEENIAIYELANELETAPKILGDSEQGFAKWPEIFKESLRIRWNEWLRQRYRDDEALRAAWGSLDEGESLKNGSVKAGRDKKVKPRELDFVRFVLHGTNEWNRELRDHCRTLAPEGVGVNVAPFSFDTQYKPNVGWSYNNWAGDVNNIGMYSFSLATALDKPPGFYVMQDHTIDDRPTVIYETNHGRPGPHRSEYPFRLAAFASWQDWDGIFWHIWMGGGLETDEDYLMRALPYPAVTHFWTAVQSEADPVLTASMALAGAMFLTEAISPAPAPTIYSIGEKGTLRHHIGMRNEAFRQGARLRFEPEKDHDLLVDGKPPAEEEVTGAVAAGEQILWDWPKGRLIIDTPTAKAYVGRADGSYRFKDGITLSGFNSPQLSWALVSLDGKPLVGEESGGAASRAAVAGMWDARNTGFDFDWEKAGGSPQTQAHAVRSSGRSPVIVDKIDWTLSFPQDLDFRVTGLDFATRTEFSRESKATNVLRMRDHAPTLWMSGLELAGRGAAMEPVVDAAVSSDRDAASSTSHAGGANPPGIWSPVKGLGWEVNPAQADKALRDMASPGATVLTQEGSEGNRTIAWINSKALFDTSADLVLHFKEDRLTRITATFTEPLNLGKAVASYETLLGVPVENELGRDQTETNVVRWKVGDTRKLSIALREAQGMLTAVFELE